MRSLKYLVPFVLVFALIVGGSLTGLFPSTVAGAVAAIALILYALCKKVPAKRVMHCVWDAAIMNAGIFPIIIAGSIFSRFVTLTRLADITIISRPKDKPYINVVPMDNSVKRHHMIIGTLGGINEDREPAPTIVPKDRWRS